MSEVVGLVNRSDIENIANAIRNKTNSENTMLISEMADIISDIEVSEIMTMPDYEEIINPDVNTYYGIHKENYVYGYAMTQANYDLITPENNTYYAISDVNNTISITSIVRLTQEEYTALLVKDANTLYLVTKNSTIIESYVGTINVIVIYYNSIVIWPPKIPAYIKQWYNICAGDSTSAPHTNYFIVTYNSLDIEHPQNGDTFYVQWFENSNELNFSSTSDHFTVMSSMTGIAFNGLGGYSLVTSGPWQNMYTSFPAQMYNREQVIPTSNYSIKLNSVEISQKYTWS